VEAVRLVPARPPACREAIEAVAEADVLVLGPGSLFTSMLPHLLVPEMAEAIVAAPARRVLVLNLAPQPGETAGFAPEAHLEALARHAPQLRFDTVIADPAAVPDPACLREACARLGARLQLDPVAIVNEPRHDPVRLADAFRTAFRDAERSACNSSLRAVTTEQEEGGCALHKSGADAYRSGPEPAAAERPPPLGGAASPT
jgi:uncharacterized cofD-like protein